MPAPENIRNLIDTGRTLRKPPLVGIQSAGSVPAPAPDPLSSRRLNVKDLMGLLFRNFSRAHRGAPPRCRIRLRVLGPTGNPAVQIRCR